MVYCEEFNLGNHSEKTEKDISEGYKKIKEAVALGIRKTHKAVPPKNGLLQKAKDYLKRQQLESIDKHLVRIDDINDLEVMSTSSMLPPAAPVQSSQSHLSNGTNSNSRDVEDTNGSPNLNEDSMMVLSQSVDSLHTVGTTSGSDGLDVSPCFYRFPIIVQMHI